MREGIKSFRQEGFVFRFFSCILQFVCCCCLLCYLDGMVVRKGIRNSFQEKDLASAPVVIRCFWLFMLFVCCCFLLCSLDNLVVDLSSGLLAGHCRWLLLLISFVFVFCCDFLTA